MLVEGEVVAVVVRSVAQHQLQLPGHIASPVLHLRLGAPFVLAVAARLVWSLRRAAALVARFALATPLPTWRCLLRS